MQCGKKIICPVRLACNSTAIQPIHSGRHYLTSEPRKACATCAIAPFAPVPFYHSCTHVASTFTMTSFQGVKLIATALPSPHTMSAHASPFPSPSPSPSDLHPLPVPRVRVALRPLHHTTRLATDRINDLLKPIGLSIRCRSAVSEIAHGRGGVGRAHFKKGRGGGGRGRVGWGCCYRS